MQEDLRAAGRVTMGARLATLLPGVPARTRYLRPCQKLATFEQVHVSLTFNLPGWRLSYLPGCYPRDRPPGSPARGHPHSGNAARGEKALKLTHRKQRQVLELPFGYMCSEQPVVFALQRARQELDERQVIVCLKRIPVVGSGHKPAFAHSCYFVGELFLAPRNMFNHRV